MYNIKKFRQGLDEYIEYARDSGFPRLQGDDPMPPEVNDLVLKYINHMPVNDPHDERDRLLTYEVEEFYKHEDPSAFRCCVAYWNSKKSEKRPFFSGTNCHEISIRLPVVSRGSYGLDDQFYGSKLCRILL